MARLAHTAREASSPSTSSVSSCIVVGSDSRDISAAAQSSTDATSTTSSPSSTHITSKSDLIIQRRRASTRQKADSSIFLAPGDDTERAMSGETLVERVEKAESTSSLEKVLPVVVDRVDEDTSNTLDTPDDVGSKETSRLSLMARATANIVTSTASALGKRGRDVIDSSIDTIEALAVGKRPNLRPRVAPKALNFQDEMFEDKEEPQSKRSRVNRTGPTSSTTRHDETDGLPANTMRRYKGKLWLTSGLYVGQDPDFDPRLNESRRKAKRHSDVLPQMEGKRRRILPMPMFAGKRLLENGRNFRLPFDICSPLPPGQSRPEEWRKTQKNVFIGDAASEWKYHKHLAPSRCLCTPSIGCDADCQNRFMLYECDDSNCNVGPDCTNRAFADLKQRVKKGNKFDIGVEVIKTAEKGFGVRANRMFAPNQIIMEYAGEIITQEECERRMIKEYKDNECYYLMVFDQNMIIDATRGSMARFVNHSCEPNCRMVKWTVKGNPRMALFAGDFGIMTGEELTYDYNFDPFSQKNVQACHCGTQSCRGFLGPRLSERSGIKPAESIVAGVKRKINQFLGGDLVETKNQKKPRVANSSIVIAEPPKEEPKKISKVKPGWYWEPIKNTRKDKLLLSSAGGSTLIEKDNIISSARLRRTSSHIPPNVQITKSTKGSPSKSSRRHTVDAVARMASSIKRNASILRHSHSKGSRCSPKKVTTESNTQEISNFAPLELDFQTETEKAHLLSSPERSSNTTGTFFESRTAGNRPMTAASIKSATASVRRGMVQSVKGPRRAAAVAKIGLSGSHADITRKTMRLISGEE